MGSNFVALKEHLKRADVPLVMKIGTLLHSSLSHGSFLELAEIIHQFIPNEGMQTPQEQIAVKKLWGAERYRRCQQRQL